MRFSFTRDDFPEGFIFGAATAAYQIEGSANGVCGPCHWDTFAATPGNVLHADDGSIACDHYHRYEEDLDIIRSGGFDAYRFSTSWARVMPDGRTVNPEGLDFYDRLVDATVERGLKPALTLYHWELPSALADQGGWTNRDTALRFGDMARVVIERIGDRVERVATLNEPWCVAWLSHFIGLHAPGLRDIRAAMRAMHHVQLAHGTAMSVLRDHGQKNLGIVLNFTQAEPASDAPADRRAVETVDAIQMGWFAGGLFKGRYPDEMIAAAGQHMPDGYEDDMALISQPMDWLGLNYYTRALIEAAPHEPWPHQREVLGPLPKTQMGWEIYPQGLEILLKRLQRDYTGDLPLMVTENGMAYDDHVVGGEVEDPVRVQYFEDHLQVVRRCIADGVPVQGYFGWSLLDNFEWALGYEKRFGLVHVDYHTQKRTPKSSFEAFRAALTKGGEK
ncbi:GH1 family beta-glucosidase [Thalassorhabdomicrobium marinisediminis]|uniref:Beta-glucosidase n=1 Tax=Thalassorhabdomicrobium marinisediminis TaxID=2170577 RepID=A0A2T7FUA4_9RHOB|nr:GH1 family beta-glucosidase [Thalassorhabdomicrobium marinisediminis]PVA05748.1 beta-glucosidase [Thalassorhabdomicrobium marinisediminis]